MKILRIRLKNLNSLRGDHFVDFTARPLADAGLFAITGPTGAGKTTLLDAITLALYGKAARYGTEPNPEDVMSRHTAECRAEVEFSTTEGVFRAVWERRRSRNKPDGALQPPKRFVYDAAGTPLTQKIAEAEAKIQELLGLDYSRFLRSVLLAQGDFARFLKANANERAELLESLTGAEIYSRLGKLAFDEAGRRETELALLEATLAQITTLDAEARRQLEETIRQQEEQRDGTAAELKAGEQMLSRIDQLAKARREEKKAREDLTNLERDRAESAADFELLRRHRLTEPFAQTLASFEAAQRQLNEAAENQRRATNNDSQAKEALTRAKETLRASLRSESQREQRSLDDLTLTIQRQTAAAFESRQWLDANKRDGSLANEMGNLVSGIVELKNGRRSLREKWMSWKENARLVLPQSVANLPELLEESPGPDVQGLLENFLAGGRDRAEQLQKAVNEAREQRDLRRDHLEKARLVAGFEDHRHNLKDGEACPLCGSLEHPYAAEGAPNISLALIEKEVKQAEKALETATNNQRVHREKLQALGVERQSLMSLLENGATKLASVQAQLSPLAIAAPAFGEEDECRTLLQQRQQIYLKHANAESDALAKLQENKRKAEESTQRVQFFQTRLTELGASVTEISVSADVAPAPVDLDKAETAFSRASEDAKAKAAQLSVHIDGLKRANETFATATKAIEDALAGSEFGSLSAMQAARLQPGRARQIEEIEKRLQHKTVAAQTMQGHAHREIALLLESGTLEGEAAAQFKEKHQQREQQLRSLIEQVTIGRQQLKTDDENCKLRSDKESKLAEARKRTATWKLLRSLIGSADGSKFRRYAQSISLDILIRHANRRLTKLSDRYRICRDETEELHLQIEDLHQANVRRPMASLSGGESFLASLALALGLSDLAGRNVKIDSLFIDEGFGTLDPETLEVAISALESLRQQKKTVAIISHVELLKERITTQIVVDKKGNGSSALRVVPGGL